MTINTRQSIYGGTGTVDLEVEGGTISLTPDEARTLADHLRDNAKEAETEQPARRITIPDE